MREVHPSNPWKTSMLARAALSSMLLTLTACIAASKPAPATANHASSAARLAECVSVFPVYDGEETQFVEREPMLAAVAELEALTRDEPSFADAWKQLGHACNLLGVDARNRGEPERARTFFERAAAAYERGIELEPSDAWLRYARALAAWNLGEHNVAIAGLTAALERAPTFVKALAWRAHLHRLAHDFEPAIEDLQRVLALYPRDAPTELTLGTCQVEARRFGDARATFARMLQADPYDARAHEQLAYVAWLDGEPELALHAIEAAVRFDPSPGPVLYPRIWLWLWSHDEQHARAEEDLRYLLEHDALRSDWERSLVAFLLDELSETELLEQARRADRAAGPGSTTECEAWFYAGMMHEQAGRMDAAARCYESSTRFTVFGIWEHEFARARLAALAASSK